MVLRPDFRVQVFSPGRWTRGVGVSLEQAIQNGVFEGPMYPVVDGEKCNGCGNCAEVCPNEIYDIRENRSEPIHPEDCIECWACVNQCPTESIRLRED